MRAKRRNPFDRRRNRDAARRVLAVLALSVGLSLALWMNSPSGSHVGDATLSPHCLSFVCWGLVLAGIAGTALVSHGGRAGWLLLLGLQPLWIAYALCTDQGGLVLGSLAYAIAQLHGFLRSGRPNPCTPCS